MKLPLSPHEQLESELGLFVSPAYFPNPNVVACSSGTAALHLAFEALSLPPGGEVILCDFNMIACPRAVALSGLVPVFVDCGDDLLLDTDLLNVALTDRTVAVLATHIYGRTCDMNTIVQFCATNNLICIEDMAEAHGVYPHKGTDAACYSFYKNKIIAGAEGGAVAFHQHRSKAAKLAKQLRSLGFTDAHDFTHIPRGHNYRMSDIHAKIILDSLHDYERNLEARRALELLYDKWCPNEWRMPHRDAPWVYDIRIPGMEGELQNRVIKALQNDGWNPRHAFKPMSMQKEFYMRDLHKHLGMPKSLKAAQEIIYLPLSPGNSEGMGDIDVQRVYSVIRSVVGSEPLEDVA